MRDNLSVEFEQELQRLRRGGGVYAPRLSDRVGPLLQELLHLSSADGVDTAGQLAELLNSASAGLPPARRALVPLAYGTRVEWGASTLSQRLELAGKHMERDMRTVQRRVKDITDRIAVELADRLRQLRGRSLYVQGGWSVERFDATLDFRGPHPVLSEGRQIRVRSESLSQVQANISLLGAQAVGQEEPVITAVEGCDVGPVSRISDQFWTATLYLPRELAHDELYFYEYQVKVPARENLSPMYGFAPLRASQWFEATIYFADACDVTDVWEFSGVPQTVIGQPMENDVHMVPNQDGSVTTTHEYLVQGLCYGVRWAWC